MDRPTQRLRFACAFFLTIGLSGCGSSGQTPDSSPLAQRGDLVASTLVSTVSVQGVRALVFLLNALGVDTSAIDAKYGVAL